MDPAPTLDESIAELNITMNALANAVSDIAEKQERLERSIREKDSNPKPQLVTDQASNDQLRREVRRQSIYASNPQRGWHNMPNEYLEEVERDKKSMNENGAAAIPIYSYPPGTEPEALYQRIRRSSNPRGRSLANAMGYDDFNSASEFRASSGEQIGPSVRINVNDGSAPDNINNYNNNNGSPPNNMSFPNNVPVAQSPARYVSNSSILYRQERDCKIALEKLNTKCILSFMEEIREFERKYDQEVKVGFLLTKKQINTVVNTLGLPDRGFFERCSREQIYGYLQEYCRPRFKLDFYNKLCAAIKDSFIWTLEFSIETFRGFHIRMLEYIRYFRKAFNFLAFGNEENIPAFDSKEYGIRKAFCGNFPTQYATITCEQLELRKCQNLDDFLHKFCKKASEDNDFSLEMQRRKPRFVKYEKKGDSMNFSAPMKETRRSSQKLHAVNFVEQAESNSSDDLNGETDSPKDLSEIPKGIDENDYLPSEEEDIDSCVSHLGRKMAEDLLEAIEVDGADPSDLNNINNVIRGEPRGLPPASVDAYKRPSAAGHLVKMTPLNPAIPKGGCIRMLRNGRCDRERCEYSHDPKDMEAEMARITRKPWLNPPPMRSPPGIPTSAKK